MITDTAIASKNVTGIDNALLDVVRPTTLDEVLAVVADARRRGLPLYPVSTGLNWGYGSHSPVRANSRLVDLSGMNRILNENEISRDNPVAVIEPGVTQGQLHDFLRERCPGLSFNVTGSARDTSIIGCALDRGVGYFGPRREDLFGMEVVTGAGEVLRTGFRRLGDESPLAYSHPYGLGPILDGLLFQGNFAIVTSACFRLRRRRPCEVAISLSLRDTDQLPQFLDELCHLKRDGVLTSVTHVGNKARNHSTLMYGATRYLQQECGLSPEEAKAQAAQVVKIVAPSEWSTLAAITGNKAEVGALVREVRARMRPMARVLVFSESALKGFYRVAHALRSIPLARRYASALHTLRPLHRLAIGEPTDIPIQNLLWKFDYSTDRAAALDHSRCGLLFVNPALPLDGRVAASVTEGMRVIAERYGFTLYVTLNIETDTSMVAVVNLLFDRSEDARVREAHECADELLRFIMQKGLSVYRARADMMKQIVDAEDTFWKTVSDLKSVFDPENIIAPGRYNLS